MKTKKVVKPLADPTDLSQPPPDVEEEQKQPAKGKGWHRTMPEFLTAGE